MIVISKKHITAFMTAAVLGIGVGCGIRCMGVIPTFQRTEAKTVVIDAGHGAPDGGAVGNNGTLEKDINLAIAQKTAEVLEGKGIKVIMTRLGDEGIYGDEVDTIRSKKVDDMHKRLDIINNSDADLFISIHMNSFTDSSANGVHVFFSGGSDEVKAAAESIQSRIADVTGAQEHSVKPADKKLYLMKNSNVPAILVECGFLSNPEEEKLLNDDTYQAKISWAIADAVDKQFLSE